MSNGVRQKKSVREAYEQATEQHRAVCSFFGRRAIRALMPRAEDEKEKNTPLEILLIHILLGADKPLTYQDEEIGSLGAPATVSNAVKAANEILSRLSGTFTRLREEHITIVIYSRHGGLQIGRYFTCQEKHTKRDLKAPEIHEALRAAWAKFKQEKLRKNWLVTIRRSLRTKLKTDAISHLDRKLHGPYSGVRRTVVCSKNSRVSCLAFAASLSL